MDIQVFQGKMDPKARKVSYHSYARMGVKGTKFTFWTFLCNAGCVGPPGARGETISIPVKGQVGSPGQHGVIGFPGQRGDSRLLFVTYTII